jgi:hypothetical protein
MTLGYATGAASRNGEKIPDETKECIDWVLAQGDESTHTYWHDKAELKVRKEAELAAEAGA